MVRQSIFGGGVIFSVLILGCAERQNDSAIGGWSVVSETGFNDHQREQRRRAVIARDELFLRLTNRPQAVTAEQGPAAAVAVCRDEASGIATAVSSESGLRIGRTSQKLRNPVNRPPEWAAKLVAGESEEATTMQHGDGRLGVLLPIRLKDTCVRCHGSPEQIAPEIRTALNSFYQDDRATGFQVGELRGWFWVEVDAGR